MKEPPAHRRGFRRLGCCSADHGQKLRCTRKMPEKASSDDGTYKPAARPPAPAKLYRTVAGSCLFSTFVYRSSIPISRFGTGFQIVRVPIPHQLKSGLQPMTGPVAKFGVAPAAVRIGPTGDEQKIADA